MTMSKRARAAVSIVLVLLCVLFPVLIFTLPRGNANPKILVIGKIATTEVEFWRSVHDGMDAASQDYKVDYTFRSMADESDVEGQIGLLEEAAAERPDALVWIAADFNMGEQAEMLAEKKVKFLTMDSDVDYDGKFKKSFVGTDNFAAAEMEGRRAASGDYGTKAAIVVHAEKSKTGEDRIAGLRAGFLSQAGNEILGTYDCGNSTQVAVEQTLKLLDEHPDVEVIFATNEVVALGIATAVLSRKLEESVNIFAFDCSKKQIQYLENGTLQAIVAQYPFRMGYRAVETAVRVAKGEAVDAFIDTGMVLIDLGNLYDKENQEILFPFK